MGRIILVVPHDPTAWRAAFAREASALERVFGEAYERNGVTVIPVATVRGTAGGGGGGDAEGNGGTGGGFGLSARPVGAFVVKGDDVSWRPAYDATRVALLGEVGAAWARESGAALDRPEPQGIIGWSGGDVILRLTARVPPERRLAAEVELRRRIKEAFDRQHWSPIGTAG